MKQSITVTAKTIDEALTIAGKELSRSKEELTYDVITAPKKGFLGIGEVKAVIKVYYDLKPDQLAYDFVCKLVKDMGLDANVEMTSLKGNERSITVNGSDAGILIGHHGETLDALQYLTNLVANKKEDENDDRDYTKISVDIENYRAKRKDTLETLAKRMAAKVLKYKKSITLEPMTPYERRIIHSTVQEIEGVSTNSIGSDNNRRVVIFIEEK